jgi:flagellar biosynthetic protein FliR
MELILGNPFTYLDTLLLVFVRTMSMMIIMPFLSNRGIPNIAKIGIGFFFSLIIINLITPLTDTGNILLIDYAILVIKEFITGWMLGFGAYIVFAILTLAGQFIDYQIGFSMVNVFDPLSQTQITITGNFYYFTFLLIFLVTRSYGYIFRALKTSYQFVPIGQLSPSNYLYDSLIEYFNTFFLLALQVAAPIFFVMLVTNVVLGILARAVPQLNMFVIGFPIKIILGLFILYFTMALFDNVAEIIIRELKIMMDMLIRGMAP